MQTDTIQMIAPAELARLWKSNPKLAVIDVRTAAEFESVHARGSQLAPLHELDERSLIKGLQSPEQPVYIFCKSGARSTQAAEKLIAAGLASPIVVEGGTDSWIAAGLPVERSGKSVMPLDRQMRTFAGTMIFAGALLALFVNPLFAWVPAFMGAGLVFAGVTGLCPMMNAIAKMPWNRASCGSCNTKS